MDDARHMRIYVPLYPEITLVNDADTNCDGVVDIKDALLTLRAVVNQAGTASDVNGDGVANLLDVIAILKKMI